MGQCIINRQLISENILTDAFEIDNDVVVLNGKILFSNTDKFDEFVRKTREKYDISGYGSVLYADRDNLIAAIDNTSHIESMAAFETPHEIHESVAVSTPEYHVDPKQLGFYKDYVKKMKSTVEHLYVMIRNMKDKVKDRNLSVTERENVMKSIQQYSAVAMQLKEQYRNIDMNVNAMANQLVEVKKVLEFFVSNYRFIKEPGLTESGYEIFDSVEKYCDLLGSKTFSTTPAQAVSNETELLLKEIRSDIKSLKLDFERQNKEAVTQYFQQDPILQALSSKELDLKNILRNPNSDEYKMLFGGAVLSDIGFMQQFFLNVDTSSSDDGLIPQYMVMKFDMIGQDNHNESTDKKNRLIEFAKQLKNIGIDMESGRDMDFIFEKTSDGIRTGNIISTFTPEFRKKINSFYSAEQKKETATMFNAIQNDIAYLNIFNLAFIHKNRNDIMASDDWDSEFYRCCEGIFHEMTGDRNSFQKWLSSQKEDVAYEKQMRDKLGDKMVDELVENMKYSVMEYWYSNMGNIVNTTHMNPFMIMKAFDHVENGIADMMSNNRIYRFVNLPLIPRNEDGYNLDFRKFFIEGDGEKSTLKREFYEFVYDNITMMQLLYTGKNSLRAMFMEENAVDSAVDAVKGIVRFDDVSKNLRTLKRDSLKWLSDMFWSDQYVSSDASKVAYNYSDPSKVRYNNVMKLLEKQTNAEIEKTAKDNGIKRSDYESDDVFKEALARKISLYGYNMNFYEVMMKSFDLYYAQKTRNEMYPVAKMLERQYMLYTTENGQPRKNANERMQYWIMHAIQKIEIDDSNKANGKLSNITILKNILSRFDDMPIVNKVLNTTLFKKMSDEEKELVKKIKQAKKDIDGDGEVRFEYENVKYMRSVTGGKVSYFKQVGDEMLPLTEEDAIKDFKDKLVKYYDKEIASIGTDATLQNVVNLIQGLLIYKMLAGVSTSGIFNRIEGHLANSEMDATGYYWKPGNLNYVEKFFLGAGIQRYITASGEKAVVRYFGADKDKQWIKRLDIIRKISDQTNIFQDMKNQFDKTIEGVQKGVKRHNFDLFQLSVTNPEFKNQMSVVLAMMMDVEIKDRNGAVHKMFDRKTGEFTCFDIKNDKLVLKDEFNIPENECWITFQSTVDEGKLASASFVFSEKCKTAIKEIHGDYRQNTALGYNNNMIMRQLMMLRRWMPQKMLRGWSEGGGYNLVMGREKQSGVWYDVVTKSKGPMMMLPLMLSTMRLHKGVFKTLLGAGGSVYMFCSVMKNKLGARKGEIKSNVSMLEESAQMLKAMVYESAIFIPRNLPRIFGRHFEFDASKHSFTDKKFSDEYGDVTLGNFRACARQTATYLYLSLLGVIAKLLFWNPDDGDDDDRRKMYNWIDNNMENILSSTTATLFMLDNIEDKADIGNIPIVRWVGDIQKYCEAINDMDPDKIRKYRGKVLLPVRIPSAHNSFNPFESDFEYQKDTWDDRYIKNIKTEGEWGAEQDYKHIRADIKRQYVDMWNDQELPDFAVQALDKQLSNRGYDNIYDVSEDEFKDMVSKSNLIPSRKQKEYRDKDYKFMHDVLLQEYEDNPYLKNHTLKYVFGGYDNRVSAYFQRMYNSDYQWVRDNPYIDDGD